LRHSLRSGRRDEPSGKCPETRNPLSLDRGKEERDAKNSAPRISCSPCV